MARRGANQARVTGSVQLSVIQVKSNIVLGTYFAIHAGAGDSQQKDGSTKASSFKSSKTFSMPSSEIFCTKVQVPLHLVSGLTLRDSIQNPWRGRTRSRSVQVFLQIRPS
jgi:hypothetical protein